MQFRWPAKQLFTVVWTLASANPVMAQTDALLGTERSYCPARPGLGTPACTIAPGHVSVETGVIDWQRSTDERVRTDAFLIGNTQVRIGLADAVEAIIGWTPLGVVRVTDLASRSRATTRRAGDALIGAKVNLANPDGSGISLAIQPFVSLPIGREPVGAGSLQGGIVAPLSIALGERFSLQFTPELDSTANSGGPGRHLAYSGVVGVGVAMSDAVSVTAETQIARDDDADQADTSTAASVSIGWLPRVDLQFDAGMTLGLNDAAPAAQVYVGVSRRF